MNEGPTATQTTPLWALLVGIDHYRTLPDLGGCLNDVEAIQAVPVREVDGNVVTLGAGLVHGLRPGTQQV
jgi:hypothetical protein